jgi:hypothetical protein
MGMEIDGERKGGREKRGERKRYVHTVYTLTSLSNDYKSIFMSLSD